MDGKGKHKGFSLVELIIVIAIMLVLVGILAPQFIRYVHRARIAADMASAEELAEAIRVMLADGGSIDEAMHWNGGEIWKITSTPEEPSLAPYLPAGFPIHGLDGISEIPTSKIDKDLYWGVYYNDDGEVFVGLTDRNSGSLSWYALYPEYAERLVL